MKILRCLSAVPCTRRSLEQTRIVSLSVTADTTTPGVQPCGAHRGCVEAADQGGECAAAAAIAALRSATTLRFRDGRRLRPRSRTLQMLLYERGRCDGSQTHRGGCSFGFLY